MLVALGARVVDPSGCEVPPGGRGLATASRIDVSGLDPRVNDVEITLATDVDNPLLGSRGAAAAFGPQKGADSAAVCFLEESMRSWANLVRATTGRDVAHWAGAGAGGGAGFAALAFLNARVRSGIDVVLESLDFEAKLDGARLVITGEGRLDSQTLGGKAPLGVARACSRWRVPVHAVVGECLLEPARVAAAGFAGCDDLVSRVPNREQAMTDPLPLLTQIGAEIARGPYLATTPVRSSTAEKMP